MPQFRTLTPEEVAARQKRRVNSAPLEPYLAFLQTFEPEDYGEITLEPNERRQLVKWRTTVAVKQLDMSIKWRRSKDQNKLLFEVIPVAL
jgi:hypothetical protein